MDQSQNTYAITLYHHYSKNQPEIDSRIDTLVLLQSPYVLRYYERTRHSSSDTMLVRTECCKYGNLTNFLDVLFKQNSFEKENGANQQCPKEKNVTVMDIFIQIIKSIQYMSENKFSHLLLTPEHILVTYNQHEGLIVRLTNIRGAEVG